MRFYAFFGWRPFFKKKLGIFKQEEYKNGVLFMFEIKNTINIQKEA